MNKLMLLIVIALLGWLSITTLGQEQELPTPIEAAQPAEVIDVVAPSDGLTPARASEIILNLGIAFGGILAAIMVAAGGGLIVIVRNLNQNTRIAIEQLAMSLPPDTLRQLREIIETVREVAELADELTDGRLPEEARPPFHGT